MQNDFKAIPKEKFEFANIGTIYRDEKLKTTPRGYFSDAFSRFKRNKSSVAAAFIIGFLILFSIVAPILSPYTVADKDTTYQNYPPFIEGVAKLGIGGFLDGSAVRGSQNELQLDALDAIGDETSYYPIIGEPSVTEIKEIYRGEERITYSYKARVNRYYEKGVVFKVISYDEFEDIQRWQNDTGIQVIYPYVEQGDVYINKKENESFPQRNSNIWYQCLDSRGTAALDSDGKRIPAYSTDKAKEGAEYNSLRIEGDDGSYIYSVSRSGSLEVRMCYYNYYRYMNGHAPAYAFGTDEFGRDLFSALGMGARFSLVFATVVSAINLTIGVLYGAVQGFYGGLADLGMDRVTDILSGVPFIVVATLFQLHLAERVGIVPSFLFAFVLTGWIGMAALTRKQFYRFKSQEYVLAARTLGAKDLRLMFKHIFPNAIGTIITSSVLVIPGVISSETTLTYLGIVNLSSFVGTSVGELMASGQQAMTSAPHAMLFPALFVSLLLISFNLFGNGLRDAFNPSTRGAED